MTRIYLDHDEFGDAIEAHLKFRIDEQLKGYLARQLKGTIEARISQMRLTDPHSPVFNEVMEEVIGKKIDEHLRAVLPDLIDAHLRVKLRHLFDQV